MKKLEGGNFDKKNTAKLTESTDIFNETNQKERDRQIKKINTEIKETKLQQWQKAKILRNSLNTQENSDTPQEKNTENKTKTKKLQESPRDKPSILEIGKTTWRLDKINPDRIEDNGDEIIGISIKRGDKKRKHTERSEIQDKEKQNFEKQLTYKFSFKIPEEFPLTKNRTVIGQWKRSPELTNDDAPILSQRIKKYDDKYYFVITDGYRDDIYKEERDNIRGNWVNMEYNVKFSDNGDSILQIKKDGTEIYNGVLKHAKDQKKENEGNVQVYFKFGIYRDRYKYTIRKIMKNTTLTKKEKIKEINEIIKAIKEEKQGNLPTIYFKDYSINNINHNE